MIKTTIDKNMKDICLIGKENIILNSLINSISLYNVPKCNYLAAQLILKPQAIHFHGDVQLNFLNIKMFYWYNNNDPSLGYVERYKLISLGNGTYLSLDPYDEHSTTSSEKDNNVIWAEKVERTIIKSDSNISHE